MLWCINIIYLISKDCFVTKNKETMCKTTWNKELTLILFREFYHDIFSKGRATLANINGNIQDLSLDYANQFCLRILSFLIVETTQYAIRRLRFIVLYKLDFTYFLLEFFVFPRFKEIATSILKDTRLDDKYTFYVRLFILHHL